MTSDSGKNEDTPANKQNCRNPKHGFFCYWITRVWRFIANGICRVIAFLKSIDGLIIAIATFFLAWLAYWQWDALEKTDRTLNQTLVAANRAWIAPVGLGVTGEIGGDKDIGIQIHYTNVGKGPALRMKPAFNAGTVPNKNPADDDPVSAGVNSTCDGLTPDNEGPVIFPNPISDLAWIIYFPRKVILPTVKTNLGAMVLQGCFVYETMSERHYTWFCFVVYKNGQFATPSATTMCKDGQGAN